MKNKLRNTSFDLFRFFTPALTTLFFLILFSYLGVFIEEQKYYLLIGGYSNPLISIVFYAFSLIVGWSLSIYIFKLERLFSTRSRKLIFIFFSFATIITFQALTYLLIFRYLTGINLFDLKILLSTMLAKQIKNIFAMLFSFNLAVAGFANLYLILKAKNNKPEKSDSTMESIPSTSNTNETSTFENAITI